MKINSREDLDQVWCDGCCPLPTMGLMFDQVMQKSEGLGYWGAFRNDDEDPEIKFNTSYLELTYTYADDTEADPTNPGQVIHYTASDDVTVVIDGVYVTDPIETPYDLNPPDNSGSYNSPLVETYQSPVTWDAGKDEIRSIISAELDGYEGRPEITGPVGSSQQAFETYTIFLTGGGAPDNRLWRENHRYKFKLNPEFEATCKWFKVTWDEVKIPNIWDQWLSDMTAYRAASAAHEAWLNCQEDPPEGGCGADPGTGTNPGPEPEDKPIKLNSREWEFTGANNETEYYEWPLMLTNTEPASVQTFVNMKLIPYRSAQFGACPILIGRLLDLD